MSTLVVMRIAIVLAGLLILTPPGLGDEPQQANSPHQEKAVDDLSAARFHLAQEIDNSALQRFAYDLNVNQLLVSGNGLGIEVAAPDATLRTQLGLDGQVGLVVTVVPEESQGAKAGLKIHDVIVEIGDEKVGQVEKLSALLAASDGKPITLRLRRNGKAVELQATPRKPELARLQWSRLADFHAPHGENIKIEDEYRLGVHLSEADDTLRNQLRLATGEGLVVTEVVADSAAAQAGVEPHDVLTVLDGKRLMTVEAINAQIKEIKERKVELRLLRGGREVVLEVAPRKTQAAQWLNSRIRYWDAKVCQECHTNVHDLAHANLAWKFHANQSAWTDGHNSRLFLHNWIGDRAAAAPAGAQQQIETLKNQLAEVQKTLATLESSLKAAEDQPAKTEEKKD